MVESYIVRADETVQDIFDLMVNSGARSFSVTLHGWIVVGWAGQGRGRRGWGILCYRLDIAIFVKGFVKGGVTGRPCQAGCARATKDCQKTQWRLSERIHSLHGLLVVHDLFLRASSSSGRSANRWILFQFFSPAAETNPGAAASGAVCFHSWPAAS